MARMKGTVHVDAPVAAVEQLGMDVVRWPDWVPGLHHAAADDGFPDPQTRARIALGARGLSINLKLISVERVPGERAEFRINGWLNGHNTWQFTPEDGGTLVTCIMEYDVPGGRIGERIYRRTVQPVLVDMFEQILGNMAEEAERASNAETP